MEYEFSEVGLPLYGVLRTSHKALSTKFAFTEFSEVAGVEVDKRRITVRATDGFEITIKAVVREDAQQAKAIIEDRLAVYGSPPLAG